MTSEKIEQERATAAQQSLAELCRHTVELIEQAQHEQPRHLSEDVDEAERAIVMLRDRLIERLRSEPGATRERDALNSVNAALSLIVGVEYPAAGIQRKLLEQAAAALHDLLKRGQLDAED